MFEFSTCLGAIMHTENEKKMKFIIIEILHSSATFKISQKITTCGELQAEKEKTTIRKNETFNTNLY